MKRFYSTIFILLFVAAMTNQARSADKVTISLDYSGAEALINAIEQDSLSDSDVDNLLRVHGVAGMVDNVTRFIPAAGREQFRESVKAFARTKQPAGNSSDSNFQLNDVWNARGQAREIIRAIKADEPEIIRRTLAELKPYRPNTGKLHITIYFVAGGVSDGFAPGEESAFYVNLARANGDLAGVLYNMAHEAYHVMQGAAQKRAGLSLIKEHPEKLPLAERLLANTLREGTANYAADATRSTASGAYIEMWRSRFERNAEPARIKENFALFDTVLSDLRAGRSNWEQANRTGFSGNDDARFYFVGYQMAKAIERYCGRKCIGKLFDQAPVEFFRQYVALYHKHPEIIARFSEETETFIESLGSEVKHKGKS